MNKNGFVDSLYSYTWKRAAIVPIKWGWVGVTVAGFVLVTSIVTSTTKTTDVMSWKEATLRAAELGDYQIARESFKRISGNNENQVLGVESDLEELVFPERKIELEIAKYEEINLKQPESRDVLLILSKLYYEIGNVEKAKVCYEKARILDPNNEIFK